MLCVLRTRLFARFSASHGAQAPRRRADLREMSKRQKTSLNSASDPGLRNPAVTATTPGLPKKNDIDVKRCEWGAMYIGAGSDNYVDYHDKEWGRPIHDDNLLFEFITLEGAQAGLSWATILNKREAYRTAFKGFDIDAVAAMTEKDVEALLGEESGIVRHRGKILSTISNAKLVQEVVKEHGSFWAYLGTFLPDGRPVINKWKQLKDVPAQTDLSKRMSEALKKKGFKFVGPTICYAFMQAVGMVNDHEVGCFCYSQCNELHELHKAGK